MIGLSVWRAIGDFFTDSFFVYDWFRDLNNSENWWMSNLFNTILFLVITGLFVYWYGKLMKFSKEGTEDFN